MTSKNLLIIFLTLTIGFMAFSIFKKTNKNKELILYHNSVSSLINSEVNVEELKLLELCKIWGALKYHSPYITKNVEINDEVLIKNYTRIVDSDFNFNAVISECIASFDTTINNKRTIIANYPDRSWIYSSNLLNDENKNKLNQFIFESYSSSSKRIVTKNSFGELNFDRDDAFSNDSTTTKAIRFLSLCKLWNIVRYYYPYFESISENWNNVFLEILPLFIAATTPPDYLLAVQSLISRLEDSHAACKSVNSAVAKEIYVSNYILKTINNTTYVKGFVTDSAMNNIHIGDIITTIDGVNIKKLQDSLTPYLSASNQTTLLRDINKSILNSSKAKMTLEIVRNNIKLTVTEDRLTMKTASEREEMEHKKYAGVAVSKVIGKNVGYLDIGQIFSGNFRVSFEKIKNCKAIIFDLRSYPNEIGCDFIKYFDIVKNNPMVLYSADVIFPGVMKTINENVDIPDEINHSYAKPVIILTNEYTQSQGESLLLAMRSSIKNSITLGDYTAGTNGNIVVVNLPGKMKVRFSGIGVLHNNFLQTQRIGIKPDVLIVEKKEDLLNGTDIQLEQALIYINNL